MRVMLEDDGDTAETAAQPTNGYRAPGKWVTGDGVEDIRRAVAKRDDNKHTPRRTRTKFTRRLGPYSRLPAIAEIDQRTVEAGLMRRVREELTDHVGGAPNAVQRLLIERATMLSLRCAQIDIKILAGAVLTAHDNSYAISWYNSLRRTLKELGIEPHKPATNGGDLNDWVRNKSRVA